MVDWGNPILLLAVLICLVMSFRRLDSYKWDIAGFILTLLWGITTFGD